MPAIATIRNTLLAAAPACAPCPPQHCLWEHQGALGWACKAELFRQAAEESDDIRLQARLKCRLRGRLERGNAGAGGGMLCATPASRLRTSSQP